NDVTTTDAISAKNATNETRSSSTTKTDISAATNTAPSKCRAVCSAATSAAATSTAATSTATATSTTSTASRCQAEGEPEHRSCRSWKSSKQWYDFRRNH